MADAGSRERLQPSLLDRLTDHAPEQRRESSDQQALTMAQLRQAVLRDLSFLLNTTNLATTEDLPPLAAASTLNFGVPGFAGALRSRLRELDLESAVTDAIRRYEPRIRPDSIKVHQREDDGTDAANPLPALVLLIEGELWAQPVPQQLFLETTIELETRRVAVSDRRARG